MSNAFESGVWPNDSVGLARELEREDPNQLVCFLLSPFEPREVFDSVLDAVNASCQLCGQSAGIQIQCRRADSLHEAKTIHDDIWRHIAAADILVIDVTELRPNVMIELGVAAALRQQMHVILIKADDDSSHLPFNAFAQRCLHYRRSIVGDSDFLNGLSKAMIQAITSAPYLPVATALPTPRTHFRVDFAEGDRPDLILSPSITHRRQISGCLEFGSFFVFRNSWLLLTNGEYRNVRVRVRFRFAGLSQEPENAFFGVSLRNQHFHANWGHLVLLRASGRAIRIEPQNDIGKFENIDEGIIPNFQHESSAFTELTVAFVEGRLEFSVGPINKTVLESVMPDVYYAGKVRLSISNCRVQIKEIEFTPIE